jgi:hypothetical protein
LTGPDVGRQRSGYGRHMTEPLAPTPQHPSSTSGAPVDDRRDDPPAPASATSAGEAPGTEAQREAEETVRSISRLEESNGAGGARPPTGGDE